MINFDTTEVFKLRQVKEDRFEKMIAPLLIGGEAIMCAFQTVRDGIVFTNKRIIAINIQGALGLKKDFTSLPYNRIQAFSIETPQLFDVDCDLELWFQEIGRIRFEFTVNSDVAFICRTISEYALR